MFDFTICRCIFYFSRCLKRIQVIRKWIPSELQSVYLLIFDSKNNVTVAAETNMPEDHMVLTIPGRIHSARANQCFSCVETSPAKGIGTIQRLKHRVFWKKANQRQENVKILMRTTANNSFSVRCPCFPPGRLQDRTPGAWFTRPSALIEQKEVPPASDGLEHLVLWCMGDLAAKHGGIDGGGGCGGFPFFLWFSSPSTCFIVAVADLFVCVLLELFPLFDLSCIFSIQDMWFSYIFLIAFVAWYWFHYDTKHPQNIQKPPKTTISTHPALLQTDFANCFTTKHHGEKYTIKVQKGIFMYLFSWTNTLKPLKTVEKPQLKTLKNHPSCFASLRGSCLCSFLFALALAERLVWLKRRCLTARRALMCF